ncbi:MAG: hypothetical protein JNL21_23955 [Myxococcales bacterium]|nr:hypothetical protein [Myxococcales bacterium]
MRLVPSAGLATGALLGAGLALVPRAALAQDTSQLPPIPSIDEAEREGTVRPAAPDERAGHVYIRAVSGLLLPAGFLRDDAPIRSVSSYGLGVGGAVGVGLSRYAEIDVTGVYGLFAAPGDCTDCSSDTVAASVGFSYHLAQGVALDPWVRLGAGYRTTSIEAAASSGTPVSGRYHGVDFMQLSLGATYFPVSSFGFGPYLEADVGTMVDSPDPRAARAYAYFHFGLRLEIDPVRWAEPPAKAASADPGEVGSSPGAPNVFLPSRPSL